MLANTGTKYACTGKPASRTFFRSSHARGLPSSVRAIRRIAEPAYFQDIFEGAADRVVNQAGALKREEAVMLVESVSSMEQAFKALELIVRHIENREGTEVNDWHHRKKYFMRLCEKTGKLGRPEVALAIFGNMQRFQVSTYFGKEVIIALGALGMNPAVLLRIAELCKMQRGPTDKGVRSAYAEVVDVLQSRGLPGDLELLPKAKADRKAVMSSTVKLAPGAPPAATEARAETTAEPSIVTSSA